MTLLLSALAEMSEQEVSRSTYSTRFQFLPPSVVLKTPRSSLGPHSRPRTQAYTTSGFFESMTIRATLSLFSSPMRVQCSPPSIDLYMPLPTDALLLGLPSPVPT